MLSGRHLLLLALAAPLAAQRLEVYTDLQRVRPDGAVAKADHLERRRELISPAVARNAFATYRFTVEAPIGSPYSLHIGQNPEDTLKVSIYQEDYERVGDEWIPHLVKPLALPVHAQLNEGQRVQSYLLDLFIPPTAEVRRFRLEIQLYNQDQWVIYPLEIRIQEPLSPALAEPRGPLPAPSDRIDYGLAALACAWAAHQAPAGPVVPLDRVSAFVRRNAAQDLLLASTRSELEAVGALLRAAALDSTTQLCATPLPPRGAEWWLRFRDAVYQSLPPRQ